MICLGIRMVPRINRSYVIMGTFYFGKMLNNNNKYEVYIHMKKMTSNEIRTMWLNFFKSKGHEIIPSASLIPHNDPTLLWINAGVAPLKKFFDGREKPNNPRMVNAQKSLRTNDIENVGVTPRHHTFFEMLGNFSIGDYFRNEALEWAYELLTSPEYFGFDINKLYMTYYPTDHETREKWISLGIPADHLIPLSGNFWEIGEGPCGPCTEIFYDRGEKYDPENKGIELIKEDIENDRYLEIWNIVFSQFNAKEGLTREQYQELPSKNIDTGAGLERLACVIQDVPTNYETDLFFPLIKFIEEYTKIPYEGQSAFKVIADHIRSVTFAISDGAVLSNEGRGYVLRRILRRAVRFGKKLGINEPFLYKMVQVVADMMHSFYPNVLEQAPLVERIIKQEEEKFLQTLDSGEKRLIEIIEEHPNRMITSDVAFLLYDTFGFPLELTKEVASEYNVEVDEEGFKEKLELQRERARQAQKSEQSMNLQNQNYLDFKDTVNFKGYEELRLQTKIIGLFDNGERVDTLTNNGLVVTEQTPFYGESGGQIGDTGLLIVNNHEYKIIDTVKLPNEQNAHLVGINDGSISVGDQVELVVDVLRRKRIMANHSATHLLNDALRKVLGNHVHQQGSLVADTYLRFDFNHYQSPTTEEIIKIEQIVKEAIGNGHQVEVSRSSLEEAKAKGAQALFGEKYGEEVRVIAMGDSLELCGGTHVANTKDIMDFAITNVEAKGSGIFRIEAATYDQIPGQLKKVTNNLNKEMESLITKGHNIIKDGQNIGVNLTFDYQAKDSVEPSYSYIIKKHEDYENLKQIVKDLEKTYDQAYRNQGSGDYAKYLELVKTLPQGKYLVAKVEDLDVTIVKDLVDKIAAHYDNIVVVFASVAGERITFVAKARGNKIHCGNLVKKAAQFTGGNGGGRPDFAQAGGRDVSKVDSALLLIEKEIEEQL